MAKMIDSEFTRDSLLYDQWVSGDSWASHGMAMPELPDGLEDAPAS